jgi:Ser/Thr protein kinase RdoA (MazF antagonist)
MRYVNYESIINLAWSKFGSSKLIERIEDISAKVSTNHVFKVMFTNKKFIIAKLSHFGRHDYFKEDHIIINALANNLLFPYEQFIAKSLIKKNEVFTYRYQRAGIDIWLVFYNPIRIKKTLPKILTTEQIINCGEQTALLHLECEDVLEEIPASSKSMFSDIEDFKKELKDGDHPRYQDDQVDFLLAQCDRFFHNAAKCGYDRFRRIPVFIDWNIGNFSVDEHDNFYARWDYDWFRVSPRMMDFYFWSRVVREEGDQTIFSYTIETYLEERFLLFLKSYHKIFPLSEGELRFLPECYRFFILHYVTRLGQYFFLPHFADRLKTEAIETYLPSIDSFKIDTILDIRT